MISILRILTRGGEGVQNPKNLADVICERPLSVICKQIGTYFVTLLTINTFICKFHDFIVFFLANKGLRQSDPVENSGK